MRESEHMPRCTSLTSAPYASQRLATSLMKEIFVANIQLDAYLTISAEGMSMMKMGLPWRTKGS